MSITPPGNNNPQRNIGFFKDLTVQIKLIWRLMSDRRVSPFLKVLPLTTLVYFIFPDLMIGPLDDALVIWLGSYLFVELCPADVVEEHRQQLRGIAAGTPPPTQQPPAADVVDGEFRDAPPEDSKEN